ncbi:MAG TPA: 4Fe-4S binding protein [Bacteroidales bacterium]|nr:4Fe-4S binding protein [Bacteroidales bacterium]
MPSILEYISLKTVLSAGFAVVIVLTLITGRTYCSFLCPLGIGQDIFSRIGGRIRKKFRRYGYKKPFTVLRYSLLGITLLVSVIWGIYMLTLLDPYSIFGRFMTFFAKPVVVIINNFLAAILYRFDIYSLHHFPLTAYHLQVYAIPAAFFLLIGILSLTKGRLYCNTVCPVGTFLGFLSKFSLLRIRFDENKCTKCGRCAVGCKSSCIDFLNYHVDVSRCVDCFNCIEICPDNALSYGIVHIREKNTETDEGKRKFIAGSLAMLLGFPASLKSQDRNVPVPGKGSTVKENKTSPVCPPGAGSIADLQKNCIACSLCITVCPTNVLQPAWLEYGVAGMMQPVMNYHKGFCNYNCNRCTEVCPTNALRPLVLEAKRLTQLGKVNFIKDNCIVKTEKTACGACAEACPTKAVYMVPYEGNLRIPETNTEICIGCGQCEYACPVTPFKAIFVDGNPVHQVAKKPMDDEADIEIPTEFPF